MITIEHKGDLVIASVFGEFSLSDYKELEDALLYKVKFHGKPNLMFDLSDMTSFTLDVAWEDLKFSKQHGNDFGKIAIVTDRKWVSWAAWLSRWFVDSEIEVFENFDLASDWAAVE